MVYAAVGLSAGVEAVEGSVGGMAMAAVPVAVVEEAAGQEEVVGFVVLVYVEVSGEDYRLALCYCAYLVQDEYGALPACLCPHVVHVQVEEVERPAPCGAVELSPCADARTGCVPAFAGTVGGLGEPEMSLAEEGDGVTVVEDGGILALALAVVASYAYAGVVGKLVLHVLQLFLEYFLGSEYVGMLEEDKAAEGGAALRPAVACGIVALVLVSDIVGADVQSLACGHEGQHQYYKWK